MEEIFAELIGKSQLQPAKVITLIAENFLIYQNQAEFLRAVIAIPRLKQLSLTRIHLIKLGRLHSEVENLLHSDANNLTIQQYCEDGAVERNLCDKLSSDFSATGRRIIFIDDVSGLLLSALERTSEQRKFLRLIDNWKRSHNHFVVLLVQKSYPPSKQAFLSSLEYLSDACVRITSYGSCYMQSIWFQPVPTQKTLIPPKVETAHYTCKIGKSSTSSDLLCFKETVRVNKGHNPNLNHDGKAPPMQALKPDGHSKQETPIETLDKLILDEDERDSETATSTLPYIRAQNPEQSRIFYYPDKDDDIDEDDPDNDLDI